VQNNPENPLIGGIGVQAFCLYSYLYDKRMTMVLAAPFKPQGIESHFQKSRPCGRGSGRRYFMWQKRHIGINIQFFSRGWQKILTEF
jgi:hypothetical protein